MSWIKQEPEEEIEVKFEPDLYQETSQDFDQRQQSEWTITQGHEDEFETKFDPDVYREPSHDFDQKQQTEWTIKQEKGKGYEKSTSHGVIFIFSFIKKVDVLECQWR